MKKGIRINKEPDIQMDTLEPPNIQDFFGCRSVKGNGIVLSNGLKITSFFSRKGHLIIEIDLVKKKKSLCKR